MLSYCHIKNKQPLEAHMRTHEEYLKGRLKLVEYDKIISGLMEHTIGIDFSPLIRQRAELAALCSKYEASFVIDRRVDAQTDWQTQNGFSS